jgi:hypothetical protein
MEDSTGDKLKRILNGDESALQSEIEKSEEVQQAAMAQPASMSVSVSVSMSGTIVMCIECGDQPGQKECLDCSEVFCEVCFHAIHRTGKRRGHVTRDLNSNGGEPAASVNCHFYYYHFHCNILIIIYSYL